MPQKYSTPETDMYKVYFKMFNFSSVNFSPGNAVPQNVELVKLVECPIKTIYSCSLLEFSTVKRDIAPV